MPYKNKSDQAKASRRHYEANKQSVKDRAKKHNALARERNRKFIIDYLSNNGCVDCGETDIVVLEFDHRDDVKKKFAIANAIKNSLSINTIMAEISKCDVRCANCHRKKTSKQFNFYRSQ